MRKRLYRHRHTNSRLVIVPLILALILTREANAIQLISPIGGEVWEAGSQHSVVWDGQCANGVNIRLFANGAWQGLAHVSTGESWTWNPVCPVASDARIWVGYVNPFGPECEDESGSFTISGPAPSVVVTSPFGGEQWAEHSDQVISWAAGGLSVNSYEIWASTNDFASHTVLVTGLSPALRNWTWYGVSPPSVNLKVRVIGHWDCGEVWDSSDNVFEVVEQPSITDIDLPNRMRIGESDYIHWEAGPLSSIAEFDVFLSRDEGATYPELIRDNHPNSNTTFYWTVTGPEVCNAARVKVVAFWLGGQVERESHDFSILSATDELSIMSPTSGAVIPWGTTQTVTWDVNSSREISGQSVYFFDENTNESTLLAQLPASDRTWQWLVQQPYGNAGLSIRADDSFCDLLGGVTVSIVDDQNRTLQVINPNGFVTWYEGECREFNWVTSGGEFTSFDIVLNYLSTDYQVATNLPPTSRSWLWENVQRYGGITSYQIEITGHLPNGNEIVGYGGSLTIPESSTPPSPRYVNASAPPGGNGYLNSPFRTVQEAIDAVPVGGTVIITSGTYNYPPDPTSKPVYLKTRQGISTLQ